jgi:hypothetical protein
MDKNGVELESAMVGDGVGDGIVNSNELHVVNYEDAMTSTERPS